jgi:hypothetical protein
MWLELEKRLSFIYQIWPQLKLYGEKKAAMYSWRLPLAGYIFIIPIV